MFPNVSKKKLDKGGRGFLGPLSWWHTYMPQITGQNGRFIWINWRVFLTRIIPDSTAWIFYRDIKIFKINGNKKTGRLRINFSLIIDTPPPPQI